MKGYKAFNSYLKCRDYQYTENEPNVYDGHPVLCHSGFHFCTDLQDILKYYCSPYIRVFEIEASGFITEAEADCSKRACSEIKLVKELSFNEMKTHITQSWAAYMWARDIGDWVYMKPLITEQEWAFEWAREIGDKEHMKQFIKDSKYAYMWARDIGDREEMKPLITESIWANMWAYIIGDEEYMIEKFPTLKGKV